MMIVMGCGEGWTNLSAPLGGNTPGARGDIGVILLNNTSYRAVLTLGSYDQSVPDSDADFAQFALDGIDPLNPNEDGGLLAFDCARVFSIGGARLLERIEAGEDVAESALVPGVDFYELADGGGNVFRGRANPFEVLLGVDFPCNALLIFKLEDNFGGSPPFRIDYELIPSSSTR